MHLIIGGFCQGKKAFAEKKFPNDEKWEQFELFVKEQLASGSTREQIQNQVLARIAQQPDMTVIATALGCGIVPMDKSDRTWREVTGRILCVLAEQADAVYRVTCGIGVQIK